MASSPFEYHSVISSVRLVQGYRYLDLCGEAIIQLEKSLHKDWIPTEAAPKGGMLRNDTLGMATGFNAESITIQQTEYLDKTVFIEQSSLIVDVLRRTFGVNRLVGPSISISYQRQFNDESVSDADRNLREMKVFNESDKLKAALGGETTSMSFTALRSTRDTWRGIPITGLVRKLEGKVVKQVARQPYDDRLIKRAGLLPQRQRDALLGLNALMQKERRQYSVAVQVDLETLFEGEFDFKEFLIHDFYTDAYDWAAKAIATI